ncbi:MAG: hypothetical protein GC180_08390 [Bacteroidetes bacterium]|nr:hypothetical protein [Bacteroidota bacterium]
MYRLIGILLFVGWVTSVAGQSGSRWHFVFGPSVTVGNAFVGGATSVSAPDITGAHHILPMFSPLWGYPNPQYSGMENLGRKLHMGFQYERFFNQKVSFVTGAVLGARGYIIKSDFSNDLLVSYRTYTVPAYISFCPWPGRFWSFRQNIGAQFLLSSAIPEHIPRNINVEQKHVFSPQIYFGLEMIHNSFSAPFSFEIGYAQGFVNMIKQQYLGVDYFTPIPIYSNGSAFTFTVKYLLKEKIDPINLKRVTVEFDEYDLLAYRNVKDPVKVQVKSDSVQICVFDDQTVDGDSIAVEFNQRLIHRNIMIERQAYCFNLVLSPDASNTLIVHALNEGKIPPNTCVIQINMGDETQVVRLKSDMKNSGAIQFYR